MEEVTLWYSKDVYRWRRGASIVWAVLPIPLIVTVSVMLASFSPFSPYRWITASLSLVVSPSQWTSILIIALVTGFIAVWNSKYYSVRSPILSTRLAHIWNIISPQRLLFVTGHTLAAALVTWYYINLIGGRYVGLSKVSQKNGMAGTEVSINEYHLFMILHGTIVGSVYAVNFFMIPNTVLTFPILQQSRFFQVKANLFPTLSGCFRQTLRLLKYYYPFYYLILGPLFKSWIVQNLGLTDSDQGAMARLYNLCDVGLLWNAVVAGTMTSFLFALPRLLFNIYQTEAFRFPIEVHFEQDRSHTLAKALVCKQLPIVQYLAYQDLCLAAQHSAAHRRELFSLSQPGGHPHNWNAVSTACLTTLRELTIEITQFNSTLLAGGQTRQLSGDRTNQSKAIAAVQGLSQSIMSNSSITQSPAMSVTNLSYRGAQVPAARLLISSPRDEQKKPAPSPSLMMKIYDHLKKRKAIAFFIGELPETASLRLFTDCRVYMWAVDALSYLVCASYNEDNFGVVQKSLRDVMTTLLNLQEAVEKHLKVAPSPNRKPGSRVSTSNSTQRQALKVTLKTAIYRIISTFDSHLSSVPLSSENTRRLGLFMEYKE